MHPMLTSYFVAPDDEQAAQVIDWPSGPVEPAGDAEGQDAFPVVDTKIEPVVTLTKLAEILSGTPYDELAADKRISTLLAQKDEYEVLVLTVSDSVKAALAGASDEDLVRAAGPWSQIEEFHGLVDPDDLLEVMRELGLLARQAVDSGHSMYVWWCA